MEELDFIKNERLKLQQEYLKQSKNIWTNFEGIEADKKHKKVYNEYTYGNPDGPCADWFCF